MRERNQLAAGIEGVRKLQSEVSDTLVLLGMAEADGDEALVAKGWTRCAPWRKKRSGARSRACCPARRT